MITRDDTSARLVQSKPQLGDITICAECGEFCEFGPRDTIIKIIDPVKLSSLEENKDALLAKRMVKAIKQDKLSGAYGSQVGEMAKAVRVWCRENPSRSPMLQRNSTSKVGIIATLADAIEHKFVSVNEDAEAMLNELGWLEAKQAMPTIFMAEAAIELAFEDSNS